jgi:hypothetical protein
LWPNASRALSLNGQEKSVVVIGATKSSLANAGAPGVLMRAVEPGNANTFGGSRDRPQNVARNIAAQNLAVPPNAEIAKSTTFER